MRLLAALVAFLVVYNNATNLLGLPDAWYVAVNLTVGVALVAAARGSGLGWADLGLDPAAARTGLRWGLLAGAVVAAALAVALAWPATRGLLVDERVAGLGGTALAWQALVRIPLGTALFEEVAFRGVLLAAWARQAGVATAVTGSSVVFGLWHIGPTIVALRVNDVAPASAGGLAALAGAVAVTVVAGLLFCWLRLRSGSLLAPVLAHTATNSLATLAGVAAAGMA